MKDTKIFDFTKAKNHNQSKNIEKILKGNSESIIPKYFEMMMEPQPVHLTLNEAEHLGICLMMAKDITKDLLHESIEEDDYGSAQEQLDDIKDYFTLAETIYHLVEKADISQGVKNTKVELGLCIIDLETVLVSLEGCIAILNDDSIGYHSIINNRSKKLNKKTIKTILAKMEEVFHERETILEPLINTIEQMR